MKRYTWIAMKLQAGENCRKSGNVKWLERHADELESDMYNTAPSGSGFDNGTELDYVKSNQKRLIFNTAYHHMDDGFYTTWTSHKVTITPAFIGFDIRITGPNKNDIKEYIADTFVSWLNEEVKR